MSVRVRAGAWWWRWLDWCLGRRDNPSSEREDGPNAASGTATETVPLAAPIYGRGAYLRRIREDESSVLVIEGDSGVGKTELILHAARATDGLAPEPVTVGFRPGALQMALLSALAAALADYAATQRRAERIAALFSEAAARVGSARLETVATAAAHFMIDVARDKLGDTAVDLVAEFVKAVNMTLDEQLMRRVTQAADPDIVEVFKAFAEQACDLVGGSIVLTLDATEKLHDDDFAQLRDLVGEVPDGLRLRLTHATPDGDSRQRVRDLRVAGACIITVEPVEDADIRQWLCSEGLTAGQIEDITRTTLGYPLFVTAAIEHVRCGGSITELRGASGFVAQMGKNFHRLGPDEQRACIQLAAFTDPPTLDQTKAILGCTGVDWGLLEGRLVERRIFPTKVNGHPWFHELGRRAIWDEAMTTAQREASAHRAAATILAGVTERGATIQELLDFARLLPFAAALVQQHEGVERCLQLSLDELAIHAALLELTEPQQPGLTVNAVVSHARQTFNRQGELETAMRALAEAGLLALAEREDAAAVVGIWPSLAARLIVQGRATAEFGRALVPSVASVTFDQLLRPVIGGFARAAYGVGPSRLSNMSRALREFDFDRESSIVEIHERSGVIARAKWGEVPFHYAVTFDNTGERDNALARVVNLNVPNFFGNTFRITSVHRWPHPVPIAARRYIDGAELCSPNVKPSHVGSSYGNVIGPARSTLKEHLYVRLAARRTIASIATPLEREILELDDLRGYIYFEDERGYFIGEVAGLDDVRVIPPADKPFAPFARDRMASAAGLSPNHEILRITMHGGGRQLGCPVAAVLDETYKGLKTFNSHQRHVKHILPLDEEAVRQALLDATNDRTRIAKAFIDAGLIAEPDRSLLHNTLRVVVRPGVERVGFVVGAQGSISWNQHPSDHNEVELALTEVDDDAHWSDGHFQRQFGLNPQEPLSVVHSDLIYGLERLLGYDFGFVQPALPDESSRGQN